MSRFVRAGSNLNVYIVYSTSCIWFSNIDHLTISVSKELHISIDN